MGFCSFVIFLKILNFEFFLEFSQVFADIEFLYKHEKKQITGAMVKEDNNVQKIEVFGSSVDYYIENSTKEKTQVQQNSKNGKNKHCIINSISSIHCGPITS